MKSTTPELDHLVLAAPVLDIARKNTARMIGMDWEPGGQHPTEGTHNVLLRLGESAYLELLAPDPQNQAIKSPRWMGVDLIKDPTLVRWCLRVPDLEAAAATLAEFRPDLGVIKAGSRRREDGSLLQWRLTSPAPAPAIEVLPFLIQWDASEHPSKRLAPALELVDLSLIHPEPDQINPVLTALNAPYRARRSGDRVAIRAQLRSPYGIVNL